MELGLLRSLMDKQFYDDHRGAKCPTRIFSKDAQKIKVIIDQCMTKYDRTITPDEVQALFLSSNPSMTTAQKSAYSAMFDKIKREQPMGSDIAQEVLSKLFQQIIGEEIANLGFDYVNGSKTSLEPVRMLLEQYGDDFTPNLNVKWDDIDIDTLLAKNDLEARWQFNIPTLVRKLEGINDGHLIEVGARPNTGKTSFHASLIASPEGFARQGAKCIVLCNEEDYTRVGARYLSAASNMPMEEIKDNYALASTRYKPVYDNIRIVDSTGKDMVWVEAVVKNHKPDIVVLDMGDKFANKTGADSHVYLKDAAIHARNIAKQYDCAVIWMSQLSAEAEGKIYVDQSMLEGSKTGKAAECDLMVLISKNPQVEGEYESDTQRHLNVAKNKLKGGWHGVVHCQLDGERARYSA